jgi:hypothetical protein
MTGILSFLVIACIGAMAVAFLAVGRLERSVDGLEERLKSLQERDAQKKGEKP